MENFDSDACVTHRIHAPCSSGHRAGPARFFMEFLSGPQGWESSVMTSARHCGRLAAQDAANSAIVERIEVDTNESLAHHFSSSREVADLPKDMMPTRFSAGECSSPCAWSRPFRLFPVADVSPDSHASLARLSQCLRHSRRVSDGSWCCSGFATGCCFEACACCTTGSNTAAPQGPIRTVLSARLSSLVRQLCRTAGNSHHRQRNPRAAIASIR